MKILYFFAFSSQRYFERETYAISACFAFEACKACSSQKQSWKRACSESWQIIVQWPGGNDSCSSFIMQILRCLQKCGKLKMMAVVRTSLQKVVVLLHRLQRMAVSSPRYQKLCKVRNARSESWEYLMLTFIFYFFETKRKKKQERCEKYLSYVVYFKAYSSACFVKRMIKNKCFSVKNTFTKKISAILFTI